MTAITVKPFEVGHVMPSDQNLEKSVLGMAMVDEEARSIMLEIIRKEHFYNDNHATIFEAIYTLYKKKQTIDLLTVTNELKKVRKLEIVGGAYAVSKMCNNYAPAHHIREHCLILLQLFLRRQSITISTESIRQAYDDHYDVLDSINGYVNSMKGLYDHISFGGVTNSDKLLIELMDDCDSGVIPGKSTGLHGLDDFIVCLEKGMKYTIGARPGMGKTALMKTMACNLINQGSPGMIFSMEITAKQFMLQVVSGVCEIENEKLRKRKLTIQDKEMIWHKMKLFRKDLLYIDDKSGITANYLSKKVKKAVKDHNIEWFMVDYTQMSRSDAPKGKMKEERIGEFSQGIKDVAKENNVIGIELSQLSKASDKESRRPHLGDLKDSGTIEASADCVMLLYRPEYYGIKYTDKEKTVSSAGAAEIIVAKNRHGRVGSVPSRFIPQFTKFIDWERKEEPQSIQQTIDDVDPF